MEDIINISFRPLEWESQVIKNETNGYVNRGVKLFFTIMGLIIQKVKLIHYFATMENESD